MSAATGTSVYLVFHLYVFVGFFVFFEKTNCLYQSLFFVGCVTSMQLEIIPEIGKHLGSGFPRIWCVDDTML